ncbi:FMN-binding negative transcriptional regulator [Neobacillus rhizosphaerae]|uniref:FMN-binding negative transcriptional regulator n=1 Tax=Neobacillus rhizosphaerae TaxID=2880965 RepID=UPI003D2BF20D
MYIPKHFKIHDLETIYKIIEKNSFATLFSQHNGRPNATHLPLLLEREEGVLYGHFARPNEQWKDIENQNVLVTFQGPHAYISPSWYETSQAVPTWNYVAVHVYGQIEILHDEQEIYNALFKMVDKYEKRDSSYRFKEINRNFIQGMSRGIVAFKIHITEIEGKAKLSQNHSVERQDLVIEQLELSQESDQLQIAKLMKKNHKKEC